MTTGDHAASTEGARAPKPVQRKPYQTPSLKTYGSIPERTFANANSGFDGSLMGTNHSS